MTTNGIERASDLAASFPFERRQIFFFCAQEVGIAFRRLPVTLRVQMAKEKESRRREPFTLFRLVNIFLWVFDRRQPVSLHLRSDGLWAQNISHRSLITGAERCNGFGGARSVSSAVLQVKREIAWDWRMWVELRNSNVASFSCLGHWESSELGKKRCSVVSLFTIGISDCWAISGRQSLKAGGADFPTLAANQSAHAHTHSLALNNSRVLGRPRVENAFRRGWRQVGEVGIYHAACSHYSTSCFKKGTTRPVVSYIQSDERKEEGSTTTASDFLRSSSADSARTTGPSNIWWTLPRCRRSNRHFIYTRRASAAAPAITQQADTSKWTR